MVAKLYEHQSYYLDKLCEKADVQTKLLLRIATALEKKDEPSAIVTPKMEKKVIVKKPAPKRKKKASKKK